MTVDQHTQQVSEVETERILDHLASLPVDVQYAVVAEIRHEYRSRWVRTVLSRLGVR